MVRAEKGASHHTLVHARRNTTLEPASERAGARARTPLRHTLMKGEKERELNRRLCNRRCSTVAGTDSSRPAFRTDLHNVYYANLGQRACINKCYIIIQIKCFNLHTFYRPPAGMRNVPTARDTRSTPDQTRARTTTAPNPPSLLTLSFSSSFNPFQHKPFVLLNFPP